MRKWDFSSVDDSGGLVSIGKYNCEGCLIDRESISCNILIGHFIEVL